MFLDRLFKKVVLILDLKILNVLNEIFTLYYRKMLSRAVTWVVLLPFSPHGLILRL